MSGSGQALDHSMAFGIQLPEMRGGSTGGPAGDKVVRVVVVLQQARSEPKCVEAMQMLPGAAIFVDSRFPTLPLLATWVAFKLNQGRMKGRHVAGLDLLECVETPAFRADLFTLEQIHGRACVNISNFKWSIVPCLRFPKKKSNRKTEGGKQRRKGGNEAMTSGNNKARSTTPAACAASAHGLSRRRGLSAAPASAALPGRDRSNLPGSVSVRSRIGSNNGNLFDALVSCLNDGKCIANRPRANTPDLSTVPLSSTQS